MFLLNLVPVVIYFYFCMIKSPFMIQAVCLSLQELGLRLLCFVLFVIVLFAYSALLNSL